MTRKAIIIATLKSNLYIFPSSKSLYVVIQYRITCKTLAIKENNYNYIIISYLGWNEALLVEIVFQ